MSFSNPASNAREAAAAYTRALFDLLGDREPLASMEELPERLHELTAELSNDQLHRPEAPGKWSIGQTVQHLADAELVFGFRMRMAVGGDEPQLPGFDQDLWAQRLHYAEVPLAEALEQLAALRAANLRLARRLTGEELARVGVHAERGPESAWHMIRMMAGHDLAHRNQIARIRKALRERPAESRS